MDPKPYSVSGAEPTVPNPACIYDYLLGGNLNFEVDRAAAKQLMALMPSMANGMRLNRWFMLEAVQQLVKQGFTCFLDLATGLPTEGYVHDVAPEAQIVYNDRDPLVVSYAQLVVGDKPNVLYVQEDIAHIDRILAAAEPHFGGNRRVGILLVGVAYFLSDDVLRRVFDQLYAWCASGSQLATSWLIAEDLSDPRTQGLIAKYGSMGAPMYWRPQADILKLLAPWQVCPPGLQNMSDWVGAPNWAQPGSDEDTLVNGYGIIVEKP